MGWNGKALISTALVVVGALMAFIGYTEMLSRPEFGLSPIEVWRESLLMMGALLAWPLNAPVLGLQRVHDIPWPLEVARFLVPLGVFSGAALLVARFFGAKIRAFMARFASDHIVVCAGGAAAWQFVADLRRHYRNRFVVLDLDGTPAGERPPVTILPAAGEITDRLLLQAAVPRARAMVALGNDDMRGIEAVLRAKSVVMKHRPPGLPPLIARAAMSGGYADEVTEALFGAHDRSFSFRAISISRNAVRILMQEHPLDRDPGIGRGGRLHVRIVGFGALGQELALEVARGGHFIDERPPLISIVDPEAAALFARLAQGRPELAKAAEFRIVAAAIEDFPAWDDTDQAPPPSRTVICLDAELPGLQTAAALSWRSAAAGVDAGPIFVHLAQAPVAAEALRAAAPGGARAFIIPFGDAASSFSRDIVLDETLDSLARVVHEHYRENRTKEHAAGAAVLADLPWDDLPEGFREASRHQADHILPKLRAIGCDVVPAGTAPAFAFRADEIELLSRIEHRRWNAERRVAGWRFAPHRCDEAREHPSLVSWEDLSEAERDKDREAVGAIPAVLARAGFAIRRGS